MPCTRLQALCKGCFLYTKIGAVTFYEPAEASFPDIPWSFPGLPPALHIYIFLPQAEPLSDQ